MPPRLPPPPQVSKPGAPKVEGASESSSPIAEPDPWLLEEMDALAGKAETDGATPPDARKSEPESAAVVPTKPASESSGVASKPASESSGARKPALAGLPPKPVEAGMPKPVSRSATAALVGIGDDLIANASAEDKPIFASSLEAAKKSGTSSEPAVFDELGLARTPAVITGMTVRDLPAEPAGAAASNDGDAPKPKKTDEGFPVPPPRVASPRTTSPPSPAATSTSRGGKPLSKWTPHVLIGALGLATIIAIAFRCSGSPASADSNKPGAVAKAGDGARGDARDVANANAGGAATAGGDASAGDAENAGAGKGDDDDDVQVEGEAAAAKDGDAAAKEGDEAAKAEDAKAEDAKAEDAKAEDAKGDEAAAGAEAAKEDGTQAAGEPAGKDATPASTSSKSSSGRERDRGDKPRSSPKPIEPSAPSPDANLTAEELLELARQAWKKGNARDTYKYANKSRYKKPSAEATELATLSACKLKLEKSAKASFDGISGDKRRKVRQQCRDYGVWVGL